MRCDADSPPSDQACLTLGQNLLLRVASQGVDHAVVDGIVQCNAGNVGGPFNPIPEDASKCVCDDPRPKPDAIDIAQRCAANVPDELATPLPEHLRYPPPALDLEAKNAYDTRLEAFLESRVYARAPNWQTDTEWRVTGPITGSAEKDADGNATIRNYGTDFPVKVADSPEVVTWMCADRSHELPDGAAIIKPMRMINASLGIQPCNDGIDSGLPDLASSAVQSKYFFSVQIDLCSRALHNVSTYDLPPKTDNSNN